MVGEGTTRTSLNSVLQRVEELMIARNCNEENLYYSAADLFDDVGREYRSQFRQKRFVSWDSLVTALRTDFLPSNYDDQLWQETRWKTLMVIHISVMVNLFSNLVNQINPLTAVTKLHTLLRHMYVACLPTLIGITYCNRFETPLWDM